MKNVYKTRDLAESAALLSSGASLIEMVKEGETCWFLFSNATVCKSLANRYYFGELLVNALSYHEAMNRLKNMIFRR